MFSDHLKTCDYCRNKYYNNMVNGQRTGITKGASSLESKPTIFIKSASSYNKRKKLSELGAIIKGISYPSLESIPMFRTKGASSFRKPGPIEREIKLRELGKIIRRE
jgi:hypothetical protein